MMNWLKKHWLWIIAIILGLVPLFHIVIVQFVHDQLLSLLFSVVACSFLLFPLWLLHCAKRKKVITFIRCKLFEFFQCAAHLFNNTEFDDIPIDNPFDIFSLHKYINKLAADQRCYFDLLREIICANQSGIANYHILLESRHEDMLGTLRKYWNVEKKKKSTDKLK